MTIITKTSDKKKLLPIPTAPLASPPSNGSTDEEAAVAYARVRARTATLLVCLLGVLVLIMGVLAGICFYRQYLREKVQRINFYMPYEPEDFNSKDQLLLNSKWHDGPFNPAESLKDDKSDESDDDNDDDGDLDAVQNFLKQLLAQFNREMEDPMREIRRMESEMANSDMDSFRSRFFREDVEVKDDGEDSYADIKIPDFRDGRRGRFIHDYKNNQTTIVDEDANRCFVYPLDYTTTLPPSSLIDALMKMQNGYYFPDTNVLRKKMRVITPELESDDEYISFKTKIVCSGMRIYKLEPFVSGVFKRSIETKDDHAKFAEFGGKSIVEFDIENFSQLLEYEANKK